MLDKSDWASIYAWYAKNRAKTEFMSSVVIKSDEINRVVYVSELFDIPIPIFGHFYDIEYFDTQPDGTTVKKIATVKPKVPQIGDIILISLQNGDLQLPKCLGILSSDNYLLDTSPGE